MEPVLTEIDPAPPRPDALALVMLGIDHAGAPIAFRDRVASAVADLPIVIGHLRRHAAEAAVISTCNRTELYLVGADAAHGIECLAHATGAHRDELAECLSARAGADAATHLFSVAAGLESQLLGETQILGQVREAFYASREAGGTGPVLAALFRHALAVGKRVRAQTGISRGAASIGSAAAAIVRQECAPDGARHAVVIGAGEAVERVLAHLRPLRIPRIDVANRTVERAARLVVPPGRALALDELPGALREADVVISATSAPGPVLRLEEVALAAKARSGRRLLLLDLAVPRDIEPAIADLPNVRLYDVDEVQGQAAANVQRRADEVERVRRMVAEQVVLFDEWLAARRAADQIKTLRERAEALRQAELRRFAGRLSERERAAVDQATRAVLRALLHGPTVALRRGEDPALGELLARAFERTRLRDSESASAAPTPAGRG